MEHQIRDLPAFYQMFADDAVQRGEIGAAVPDAFGIDHQDRPLVFTRDHALRTGALDPQCRQRIDAGAHCFEHGLRSHTVFGAARANAHEYVPGMGSQNVPNKKNSG